MLFRARTADGTVGCLYNFVEGRRVLSYQFGLASYSNRRISPGFVTFVLCMRACVERGLTEYDFLAGDSTYKRQLSTMTRELVWASARRPALRWRLMDGLTAGKRRLRPSEIEPGT
jgi:CelD/BcsL family acetyltransferase involved in cellulose biosynthesis